MQRIVVRYGTPFGSFVSRYGANRLASAITSTGMPTAPQTVYGWLRGDKSPAPARAIAIVQISQGEVRLEDVFAHRAAISQRQR